ncbi:MAG: hypothetical protein KJ709_03125 [Nanoarchaeota archaeon]|nr:hypothetical protein [Nanoarchaeota archaeon]
MTNASITKGVYTFMHEIEDYLVQRFGYGDVQHGFERGNRWKNRFSFRGKVPNHPDVPAQGEGIKDIPSEEYEHNRDRMQVDIGSVCDVNGYTISWSATISAKPDRKDLADMFSMDLRHWKAQPRFMCKGALKTPGSGTGRLPSTCGSHLRWKTASSRESNPTSGQGVALTTSQEGRFMTRWKA